MAHYDVYFTFGKIGTYLLDHPKNIVKRNIPDELRGVMDKNPVQKIITVAMDANDNYFAYWKTQDGSDHWARSGRFNTAYPKSNSFWEDRCDKGAVGIAIGPDIGDHLTWRPGGGSAYWGNKGIFDFIKDDLTNRSVRSAAFGVGNALVVLFTDGKISSRRLGEYPDLCQLLEKQPDGYVIFVAMNPYCGNEYFVVLKNAEVHIRASAVAESDIAKVLKSYPEMEVITSTVVKRDNTISSTSGLPKHARRKEFLSGIASAAVMGLVSAAFGACSVM